jgi:hypothetical protein
LAWKKAPTFKKFDWVLALRNGGAEWREFQGRQWYSPIRPIAKKNAKEMWGSLVKCSGKYPRADLIWDIRGNLA